jgi:hypothetical protein
VEFFKDQFLDAIICVIYINELPEIIGSLTKLDANDNKILSKMSSEKCLGKVQADFDNAYKWTQEWFQKLNIDKCLVMHYGLSNNKYLLHINGKQLVKSDLKEI